MNQPHELRFFHNDKLSVLTQNKIATRFLRDTFESDSYNIDVDIDSKGNFQFIGNSTETDILYEISKSNNISHCLMIIRHPEKRLITGLVQDILDNFMGVIDSPFFYKYLSNHIGKSFTYEFTELFKRKYYDNITWEREDIFHEFKTEFNKNKDGDLFTFVFHKIFESYIKVWGDLNIWERGHNNQYLFSFYELYQRNQNIKVFDLDENKNELSDYLNSFGFKTEFEKRSNSEFKKLLEGFFELNQHLYRKLSTTVIERDLYFYTYLKDKI